MISSFSEPFIDKSDEIFINNFNFRRSKQKFEWVGTKYNNSTYIHIFSDMTEPEDDLSSNGVFNANFVFGIRQCLC